MALVGGGKQPKFPQNKVGKRSMRETKTLQTYVYAKLPRSSSGMMQNRKQSSHSSSAPKSIVCAFPDHESSWRFIIAYISIPFRRRLGRSLYLRPQIIRWGFAAWVQTSWSFLDVHLARFSWSRVIQETSASFRPMRLL